MGTISTKLRPEDYVIHNAMEDVADQAIQRILTEEPTACGCPLCRSDMKSLMLNRLNPLYYPILQDGMPQRSFTLERLETELFNRVMIECYSAVMKTKAHPRHDQNRSMLQNSTESIVLHAVQEILAQEKITLGRDDLSRLMAGALNGLKPHYTTTPKGDVFSRTVEVDTAYLAKVYASIYNTLKDIRSKQEQTPL